MKHGSFLPVASKQIKGIPEDSGYLDSLLASRDKQILKLTQLLQKRASARDNLNVDVKEVEVLHDVALEITANVLGSIDFIQHNAPDHGSMKVELTDARKAKVTFRFDTDPGERVKVKLLIWGT